MKQYEYVLFDLDGTILDTSSGILKSIDHTIGVLGLDAITEEKKRSMIGPPIERAFERIYGISKGVAAKAAAIFREVYEDRFLFDAVLYPEIIRFLDMLKKSEVETAIVTYKKDRYAQKLFDRFGLTKKCGFCLGSDDKGRLSKGDIISICMERLDCQDISKAVIIGDTLYDAIGARQTGIDFWGVTYGFGFHSRQEVLNSGAQAAFGSIGELIARWEGC